MRRQYRKATTPTLRFHPPEGVKPDGDVVLNIYESGTSLITGTWPQTITPDTASATVATAATLGATEITVDDSSGFARGRRYLVVSEFGDAHPCVVVGNDASANRLRISPSLPWDITTDATIVGYAVEYTFTAAQTAARNHDVRCEFTYDVSGDSVTRVAYVDVVSLPFDVSISDDDMRAVWPGFDGYKPAHWRTIVREHIDGPIFRDLREQGYHPERILRRELLTSWVVHSLIVALLTDPTIAHQDLDMRELLREFTAERNRLRGQAISAVGQYYDADDDLSTGVTGTFADNSGDWTEVGGRIGDSGRLPVRRDRIG